MPEDESQLKAFLGTASYYRQFVPNYAAIVALHSASQKGERFRWTVQCEEAFASIKWKLTNAPILAFPQLDEPQEFRGSVFSGSGWERARYSL